MRNLIYLNIAMLLAITAFGALRFVPEGIVIDFQAVAGHLATLTASALAAVLLVLLGRDRSQGDHLTYLMAAGLTFIVAMMLTYAPFFIPDLPAGGAFNWAGKSLSLLYCLVAVALLPKALRQETGILRLPRADSLRATGVGLTVFAALGLALALTGGSDVGGALETAAFQLTLPSLSEEILFRGILLALFGRVALSNWSVLGTRMGWGVVASCLLFGLVHGFLYSPSTGFIFDWVPIVATGILGAAMAWIALRSGSVWPAIIAHSLLNATGPVLNLVGIL